MVPRALVHFSNSTDAQLGAPETFRSHKDTEASPLQITPAVDVWSIGCVFSEVTVWAHHGWKKVVEYRRQRSMEIKSKGGDEGEHIFHFGGELLHAVEGIHQDILEKTLASHRITRSVLDSLVNDMLQHGTRPSAKFVFEKSKRLIGDAEKRFGVSVAGTVGNTNGAVIGPNGAMIMTRSPPRVPNEYHHSRAEWDSPIGQPLPPDHDSTPSSSSSRSQSPHHRHHPKSPSQSSKPRSNGVIGISPSGGQGSHVVPDPPPPPPSPPQQVQEEQVRPNLSIEEGHIWKKKKKEGEFTVLPGEENLTSLNQRDHVSQILAKLNLADV